MTPCCVPIENGKWHVVRGARGQIFLPLSFILFSAAQRLKLNG